MSKDNIGAPSSQCTAVNVEAELARLRERIEAAVKELRGMAWREALRIVYTPGATASVFANELRDLADALEGKP